MDNHPAAAYRHRGHRRRDPRHQEKEEITISQYISITEFAEKFNMHRENVFKLIKSGRLPAVRIGKQWAIPADAEKPEDLRVTSGKYRNWRKNEKREDG